MAYVAISGELLTTVRAGIQQMKRKELETIGEVPRLAGTESIIEQALWGQYAHLKPQLPKEWKSKADRVVLQVRFPTGDVWQDNVFFVSVQDGPPHYSCYSPPKFAVPADHPDITKLAAVVSNRRDAQYRWEKVEHQVLKFLEECKSLNEGLKLWPDLRMYVPKHFLDRVERKTERTKDAANSAAEALKNINTDDLVAAAVIARMSTGKTEEP